MQTRSDRLNEDVLRLNGECKLRALLFSPRCIHDINITRVVTSTSINRIITWPRVFILFRFSLTNGRGQCSKRFRWPIRSLLFARVSRCYWWTVVRALENYFFFHNEKFLPTIIWDSVASVFYFQTDSLRVWRFQIISESKILEIYHRKLYFDIRLELFSIVISNFLIKLSENNSDRLWKRNIQFRINDRIY